jgi:hypothetical protein
LLAIRFDDTVIVRIARSAIAIGQFCASDDLNVSEAESDPTTRWVVAKNAVRRVRDRSF